MIGFYWLKPSEEVLAIWAKLTVYTCVEAFYESITMKRLLHFYDSSFRSFF